MHAMPAESDHDCMAHGSRYADGSPVTTTRPTAVIAAPLAGERVRPGRRPLRDRAWGGTGAIRAVDVSAGAVGRDARGGGRGRAGR
ncbi:hypothetical protein tb265_47580 [Gemmatimonadetes bacterium T265]|nr:hypothetical protein tb265_47580 [Gemmatimonadetes bacterium T265]